MARGSRRNRRDNNKYYFTLVYLMVAVSDVIICSTTFPVALSYVTNREAGLFGIHVFCAVWGFLWEVIPYLSVYLVVVMAVSRASTLTSPLKVLNIRAMTTISSFYLILCLTSKILPQLMLYDTHFAFASFHFNRDSLYCFLYPMGYYWVLSSIQASLQLGLPAPVIFSSCGACLVVLRKLRRRCKKLSYNQSSVRRRPTTTILILSGIYTACNIPVFLNYVLYSFTWVAGNKYTSMYNNTFLYWYSWNITYVVSVCVNSTINPIVLILRMAGFREWAKIQFRTIFGDKWRTITGRIVSCLARRAESNRTPTGAGTTGREIV